MNISFPYYPFAADWEKSNVCYDVKHFVQNNQISAYAVGVFYVALIFWIQACMKNRKPFRLMLFSILWNSLLTILNTAGFLRVLIHMMYVLKIEGFYMSVCHDKIAEEDTVSFFWLVIFPLVKILELGDTVLIVLQKRYLATFYWAHHLFALIVTWYIFPYYITVAEWLALLIYFNHIPIYALATVKSFGVKLRREFAVGLMVAEVGHMVCGLALSATIYWFMYNNLYCDTSLSNNIVITATYVACFILAASLLYFRFLRADLTSAKHRTAKISTNKSVPTISAMVV